jgi:hypothetical protein
VGPHYRWEEVLLWVEMLEWTMEAEQELQQYLSEASRIEKLKWELV